MPATLDEQLKLLSDWGIVENPQRFNEACQVMTIDNEVGEGRFERYVFDDINLSRVNCQFDKAHCLKNAECHTAYVLYIVLQGYYQFNIGSSNLVSDNPDSTKIDCVTKTTINLTAPAIWLFKGDLGEIAADIPAAETIKALYIELQDDFIGKLTTQLSDNPQYRQLLLFKLINTQCYRQVPLTTNTEVDSILKSAWRLFSLPSPTNDMSFMALQGQVLSFTSQLLMQRHDTLSTFDDDTAPTYALQAKLLLDKYYYKNWTTRQLAQRVGTNECYLKKAFKQLTSYSLGEYRVHKRMESAKELLAQGEKTATIAHKVGFNSTEYFVKVFLKHFGYHPSQVAS